MLQCFNHWLLAGAGKEEVLLWGSARLCMHRCVPSRLCCAWLGAMAPGTRQGLSPLLCTCRGCTGPGASSLSLLGVGSSSPCLLHTLALKRRQLQRLLDRKANTFRDSSQVPDLGAGLSNCA